MSVFKIKRKALRVYKISSIQEFLKSKPFKCSFDLKTLHLPKQQITLSSKILEQTLEQRTKRGLNFEEVAKFRLQRNVVGLIGDRVLRLAAPNDHV